MPHDIMWLQMAVVRGKMKRSWRDTQENIVEYDTRLYKDVTG